jgi:hypothetical protein
MYSFKLAMSLFSGQPTTVEPLHFYIDTHFYPHFYAFSYICPPTFDFSFAFSVSGRIYTMHCDLRAAWKNISNAPCRMAFVLIDHSREAKK